MKFTVEIDVPENVEKELICQHIKTSILLFRKHTITLNHLNTDNVKVTYQEKGESTHG